MLENLVAGTGFEPVTFRLSYRNCAANGAARLPISSVPATLNGGRNRSKGPTPNGFICKQSAKEAESRAPNPIHQCRD